MSWRYLWCIGIGVAIAAMGAAPANAATIDYVSSLPMPTQCRRATLDASGVLSVHTHLGRTITLGPRPHVELNPPPPKPFFFTTISNDRGADPAWLPVTPGSDAPGVVMLQVTDGAGATEDCIVRYMARFTYEPEELVGYNPADFPNGEWVGTIRGSGDVELAPLDQVHVLRIVDEPQAPLEHFEIPSWKTLTQVSPGFRLEFDTTATGHAPSLRVDLGADALPAAQLTALAPNELDLNADARADITWAQGVPQSVEIVGTAGADRIDVTRLSAASISIQGGDGNDVIVGSQGSGETSIVGGAGDDDITTGAQGGRIDGGAGNDVVRGVGVGILRVKTAAGDDVVDAGARRLNVSTGSGNDLVRGGSTSDVIDSGDGADRVYGGGGNDAMQLGDGDDIAHGDEGSDLMRGGPGRDLLRGGSGHDQLYGEAGNDRLYGEAGYDRLMGNTGNDRSWGGPGRDVIGLAMGDLNSWERPKGHDDDISWGGPGSDVIGDDGAHDIGYGGPGNDYMKYQGGIPRVYGEGGRDWAFVRVVGGAVISLGAGDDVLRMGGISIHAPRIGRNIRVSCGSGSDWLSWQPVRITGCEWQQQRDQWDHALGRPIRDDTGMPQMPSRPPAPACPWKHAGA